MGWIQRSQIKLLATQPRCVSVGKKTWWMWKSVPIFWCVKLKVSLWRWFIISISKDFQEGRVCVCVCLCWPWSGPGSPTLWSLLAPLVKTLEEERGPGALNASSIFRPWTRSFPLFRPVKHWKVTDQEPRPEPGGHSLGEQRRRWWNSGKTDSNVKQLAD